MKTWITSPPSAGLTQIFLQLLFLRRICIAVILCSPYPGHVDLSLFLLSASEQFYQRVVYKHWPLSVTNEQSLQDY